MSCVDSTVGGAPSDRVRAAPGRAVEPAVTLDLVGGIHLVGGHECKILTGMHDHSRIVVVATVLEAPSGTAVVDAFVGAMERWGVPVEVLTENGKQSYAR